MQNRRGSGRTGGYLISRVITCPCSWRYGPNTDLKKGDIALARHRQRCDVLRLEHLQESDVQDSKERGYL